MREIKFRAWYEEEKEMQRVTDIYFNKKTGEIESFVTKGKKCNYHTDLDNHILMQYTGLRDKNGVEIYEGDIVRFKFKNEIRIGFVEYVRSSFLINVGEIICDNKIRHSFSNSSSEEHEIIGNIYQNKCLLEG